MNFLSHGFRYLDSPYMVAGTAVPDWLSVMDRRTRARSKHAISFLQSDDEQIRQLAMGIMQHHKDDLWFHSSRLFNEMMLQFAVELRDHLPGDEGFRPSFVGHILVEILIDAALMRRHPSLADQYYQAIGSISPEKIESVVQRIAMAGMDRGDEGNLAPQTPREKSLAHVIRRFADARFLYDYADDDKLLFRLNQVMGRVGLPSLPSELVAWLSDARQVVDLRCDALLTPDP